MTRTETAGGRKLAMSSAFGLVFAILTIGSADAVGTSALSYQDPPRAHGVDRYGDPLPPGAIARLGSMRFRHEASGDGTFLKHIAFSRDGKTLLTLGGDGEARIWNAATGRLERSIATGCWVTATDGATIYAARPGLLVAFDRTSGRELRRRATDPRNPGYLAVAPNGKLLALIVHQALGEDRELILYDTDTLAERWRVADEHRQIRCLAFSPDGRTLAFAGPDRSDWAAIAGHKALIRMCAVENGKEVRRISLDGHSVGSLAFSPDGRSLAVGVGDRTIRIHDPATGCERLPRLGRPDGRKDADPPPVAASLAFSPDGRTLAAGPESTGRVGDVAHAPSIVFWDVAAGREIGRAPGHPLGINSLAFSPDGKVLASAGGDEVARLWEVPTGREVDPRPGHPRHLSALAVSPTDGTVYTAGLNDGQVLRWNPDDGHPLGALPISPRDVDGLAISADGRKLFVGAPGSVLANFPGTPTVLDLAGRKPPRRLVGLTGGERFARSVLSPDGSRVATGSGIWNADTGKRIVTLHGKDRWHATAFTSDGRELIATGADGVHIVDAATGAELDRPVRASLPGWDNAAISPDGRFVAVGNVIRLGLPTVGGPPMPERDPALGVWELASGRRVARLFGHTGQSVALAFSPDGRKLASIGGKNAHLETRDQSLRVWDIPTGRQELRLAHPIDGIPLIAHLPDGRSIVTAGHGTALVWDVSKPADRRPPEPADAPTLESLWDDLASDDGPRGFRASWAIVTTPGAVAFLRDRLRPVPDDDDIVTTLRTRRAIAALERIGDPPARAVLETLARSKAGAATARDAADALLRLSRIRPVTSIGPARK